jgi:hypothetical protein
MLAGVLVVLRMETPLYSELPHALVAVTRMLYVLLTVVPMSIICVLVVDGGLKVMPLLPGEFIQE